METLPTILVTTWLGLGDSLLLSNHPQGGSEAVVHLPVETITKKICLPEATVAARKSHSLFLLLPRE